MSDDTTDDLPLEQRLRLAHLEHMRVLNVSMLENTRMQTEAHNDRVTMRDYFACQALSSVSFLGVEPEYCQRVAQCAYAMADAMLAERSKKK